MKKKPERINCDLIEKIWCLKLEPGDYVLVAKKGFTGKHKIVDRWELHPYSVISKHEVDVPVFLVESLW